MTRLRSRMNPEEQRHIAEGPAVFKAGANQFALLCSLCAERYYVDEATFEQATDAIEKGLDSPFCCDDCQAEYEDLSHPAH